MAVVLYYLVWKSLDSQRLQGGCSDIKPRIGQALSCRESNFAGDAIPKSNPCFPNNGLYRKLITHSLKKCIYMYASQAALE